jgi:cytochrome b involved in lipid metabolism
MSDIPERKELKAGWKNEVEVQKFTKKDVAKHNTKQDNWIIIHGKGMNSHMNFNLF